MKLNDAVLQSMNINGIECSTKREFVSQLEKAKDLSMEVYINTRKVCSGPAHLMTDNHWIIASTDAQLSFKESVPVEAIVVRVVQQGNILFESITSGNTIIPADDIFASFYVCLINDSPYNELDKRIPESTLAPASVNRLADKDFESIKDTLNPEDVEQDGETTEGIEQNENTVTE